MRHKKMTIGLDDYIKVNRKLSREEELARNGGRWVAKDRPHKNKKAYDRKRDKKNLDSFLSLSSFVTRGKRTFRSGMLSYFNNNIFEFYHRNICTIH